ncbi:MAG: hypothetical protein MI922_14275 [Bacteroidales bacterium]|nr:hypothetical protein [Bacteroidales bacterium]
MKKTIIISAVMLLVCIANYGQQNRISISGGYPVNLTNYWMVDKWEKPLCFDLKFNHTKKILLIGGGINYSKYDISWFRYYDSDKNTISNITPYLQVGLYRDKKIVSWIPHIDLGYSTVITDIDIYDGDKSGFYTAAGLDCNFKITEKFHLGMGANYSLAFLKIHVESVDNVHTDFIPVEDNRMQIIALKFNLVYVL